MLKSELEALLSLRYAILLQRDLDPRPFVLFFIFEDRQVSFFEELDLVAHVDYDEGDCHAQGDAFRRKMEPSFIGGMGIGLHGQMKLKLNSLYCKGFFLRY
jgi:hypothetical protein